MPDDIKILHERINAAAIVGKSALLAPQLTGLSKTQLTENLAQAIDSLNKIEEYVVKTDKVIEDVKQAIYKEVGGDVEIV